MQSPYPSSSLSEPLRPLRLRIPGLRAKPALCPSVILTPEICAGHEELRAEKAPSLIPDLGCGRSSRQANPWRKISSSANFSSSAVIREIFAGDEISNHLRERDYQPRMKHGFFKRISSQTQIMIAGFPTDHPSQSLCIS